MRELLKVTKNKFVPSIATALSTMTSASIPTSSASIVTSENTSVRENKGEPSDWHYERDVLAVNRIYYASYSDADDGSLAFRRKIRKRLYLPIDAEFRTDLTPRFQEELSFAVSSANTEEEEVY